MTLTLAQQLNDLFSSGRYHDLIAAARNSGVTPQLDPVAAKLLAAALFSVGEFAAAAPLQGHCKSIQTLAPSVITMPTF
jgi:hypothetical protein